MYHKKFAEWREMGTFPRKKRRRGDFTGGDREHHEIFPDTLRPCGAVSDGPLMTERERSVSLGKSDSVHSIAVPSDLFANKPNIQTSGWMALRPNLSPLLALARIPYRRTRRIATSIMTGSTTSTPFSISYGTPISILSLGQPPRLKLAKPWAGWSVSSSI